MTDELTPKFKLMPIYRCADCNLALGCKQFHEGHFDYNKTVAPDCPLDTYGELPQWAIEAITNMIAELPPHVGEHVSGKRCALKKVLSLQKPEEKE